MDFLSITLSTITIVGLLGQSCLSVAGFMHHVARGAYQSWSTHLPLSRRDRKKESILRNTSYTEFPCLDDFLYLPRSSSSSPFCHFIDLRSINFDRPIAFEVSRKMRLIV